LVARKLEMLQEEIKIRKYNSMDSINHLDAKENCLVFAMQKCSKENWVEMSSLKLPYN